MKKFLFSTLAVLVLTALAQSCSHFDKLGQDPYALYDAPSQEFVHPIVFNLEKNSLNIFKNTTSLLMQYAASNTSDSFAKTVDGYNITEGIVDDIWSTYYPLYGNAVKMYDQAVKEGNEGLQGVALILKSFIISQIADAYGNVPYKDAAQLILKEGSGEYSTAYDEQKDIYYSVVAMLEDANKHLAAEKAYSFNSVCDKTYLGVYEKWRRLGNTLYARVLMRIAMKVVDESDGLINFPDGRVPVSVTEKLATLYHSYLSGKGDYPVMRGAADRPMVHFDKNNEVEQSPFFGVTSGIWRQLIACDFLVSHMLDGEEKIFEIEVGDKKIRPCGDLLHWFPKSLTNKNSHAPDPRFGCWWHRIHGIPPQMEPENIQKYTLAFTEYDLGTLGALVYEGYNDIVWEKKYELKYPVDVKNPSQAALMQYSELLFVFAEAGARGYIPELEGEGPLRTILKKAITESILEWNDHVNEGAADVVDYVNWVLDEELFSGAPFFFDANDPVKGNALEVILTEKWLASFFIGIESWCDYRRTGFPLLKTNGPVAENDQILPTRFRYPADEKYRNVNAYADAVNGWLGGVNNMTTDVWWADTQESKDIRKKGRE